MNITKSQRITISQIWNKVCKDRGWATGDRALRLATLGELLGRPLETMDDIGRLDECTKVMHGLNAMLGINLKSALEATDPTRNQKRNSTWIIFNEILPCLELYPLAAPMGRFGAETYLQTVLVDKSRWRRADRPEREPILADFDERTCQQILWTLSARLNDKRREAGHTGHQMRIAAGVPCDCAKICRKKLAESSAPIPALAAGQDEAARSAELIAAEDPDWTA